MKQRLCACRGVRDPLRDQRAARATFGALASRAFPLGRAVARVCQGADARVARGVRLADMNPPIPVPEARRTHHLRQPCHSLRRAAAWSRQQQATRRQRRDTYAELSRSPRCHLMVLAVEVGGPPPSCASLHERGLQRALASSLLELPLDTVASLATYTGPPGRTLSPHCLHACRPKPSSYSPV